MSRCTKNMVIFSSGVGIGFIIGGVYTTKKFLENRNIAEAIVGDISRKVMDRVFDNGDWKDSNTKNKYSSYKNHMKKRKIFNPFEPSLEQIIFNTKEEAEEVFNSLLECIENYGFVSVLDYFELSGYTGEYKDSNYGWYKIEPSVIKKNKIGYYLHLPEPIKIEVK